MELSRWCYLESIISYSVNYILKEYLGGESVAMIDDGLSIGTIPAVHFHTSAASTECPEL